MRSAFPRFEAYTFPMAAHRRDTAEDRETSDEQAAPEAPTDPADAGPIATATRVPVPFAPPDGETDNREGTAAGDEGAGDETVDGDPIYPRTRAP